jgi:hypothetical protein
VKPQEVTAQVIERIQTPGTMCPRPLELPLLGMTCANCANTIERA